MRGVNLPQVKRSESHLNLCGKLAKLDVIGSVAASPFQKLETSAKGPFLPDTAESAQS
jgi:hypothetical protein